MQPMISELREKISPLRLLDTAKRQNQKNYIYVRITYINVVFYNLTLLAIYFL